MPQLGRHAGYGHFAEVYSQLQLYKSKRPLGAVSGHRFLRHCAHARESPGGNAADRGEGHRSASVKTRTKDKYRVVYTDHQRLELEKEFHYSRYITIRRKAELAATLGLSERQVKIWFQNRRAKERKINKKKLQQQQQQQPPQPPPPPPQPPQPQPGPLRSVPEPLSPVSSLQASVPGSVPGVLGPTGGVLNPTVTQ
ncbi:homeobox protein CDX-2 isoform X4 [Homo sapiens]|uniref:homeobox protein CDX-2 isoform X4 n=1 Tax=Homo sapiens TaxID=9606 RepID=UPI0005D000E7|nr:homeobox protein CDX-2 isoform X4 [Homo sapiens]|eukprot:XP_011533181.1 homeobox protein CDX-2 isoform X4 [Homo sapiens]